MPRKRYKLDPVIRKLLETMEKLGLTLQHPDSEIYRKVWFEWVREFLMGEHNWEFMNHLPKRLQSANVILEALKVLRES